MGLSVVIAAAAGGIAGKFAEKVWDEGQKWLTSLYKDHGPVIQEKAEQNALEFIAELANRIKTLEKSKLLSKEKINSAQENPEFSILLQKAILASAETERKEKHIVLARLVSERLKSDPETILSVNTKMAVNIIPFLTINQLMILGLYANLFKLRCDANFSQETSIITYQKILDRSVIKQLKPFQNIIYRELDLAHLDSNSCVFSTAVILDINGKGKYGVNTLYEMYKNGKFFYDFELMADIDLKNSIKNLWENGIRSKRLTPVGTLIGISVSDLLFKTNTSLEGWE